MFMDGLLYSSVSKNLSLNFFSNNHLYLSKSFLSDFHEQPPLVFYIQGLFIRLLGDYFFIDRLYSYVCFGVSIITINAIAKEFTVLKNYSWIAAVFFMFIPVVDWSFKNNMLENSMCVFTLLSIYTSFKYYNTDKFNLITYSFLNSLLIILAFLCKGFTGLFMLAFPFFFAIIFKRRKNGWMAETTLLIVNLSILSLAIIFIFPSLFEYLKIYFNTQVIASVKGNREVDGHFFIVKRIPQELLILLILTMLLHIKYKKQILSVVFQKVKNNGQLKFFFLLAIAGSLPIMISPKQSGYYVLCSYPLFAIFFALLNFEEVKSFLKINWIITKEKPFRRILLLLTFASIALMIFNYKKFYRDKEKINMIDNISSSIKENKKLNISWELANDYSLYGYFARRHNLSLYTPNYVDSKAEFLLSKSLEKDKKIIQTFIVNQEKYYLLR
jgi:4-amino-4-deoxy-L-arabinose transferase-like glycosyltransferase